MTKLILSTSNLINGSSSISRRPLYEKSNTEFISSLRANFNAAQQAAESLNFEHSNGQASSNGTTQTNGSTTSPSYTSWTSTDSSSSTVYIPSLPLTTSGGLIEERSEYDITVKLFFLPTTTTSERTKHTASAIKLVLEELKAPNIDLLIVSYPGITFDADDYEYDSSSSASESEDEDEAEPPTPDPTSALPSDSSTTTKPSDPSTLAAQPAAPEDQDQADQLDDIISTWQALEELQLAGTATQIGVSEFGSERLKKFLPRTRVRPSVDQINVRDCCVVPRPLVLYAKEQRIELLTHNDCTNILPKGSMRELLGPNGAGVLCAGGEGGSGDQDGAVGRLKGEVEPQWVVKYTAVVRDRGVIENKGYFAMAEVRS